MWWKKQAELKYFVSKRKQNHKFTPKSNLIYLTLYFICWADWQINKLLVYIQSVDWCLSICQILFAKWIKHASLKGKLHCQNYPCVSFLEQNTSSIRIILDWPFSYALSWSENLLPSVVNTATPLSSSFQSYSSRQQHTYIVFISKTEQLSIITPFSFSSRQLEVITLLY